MFGFLYLIFYTMAKGACQFMVVLYGWKYLFMRITFWESCVVVHCIPHAEYTLLCGGANPPMTSFLFLLGRRAGTSIQPDDAQSAGLQWEPWAPPHVSGSSHGSVPAPASSDQLHHGYHGSAYAASVWLPACHWTPPSSTSTTSSIPARHAGPTTSTRLHAAPSTTAGICSSQVVI